MTDIKVHPRVNGRHPEISDDEVIAAWNNPVELAKREGAGDELWVAAGFDNNGRPLEVVASKSKDGIWLIFHAMKATTKTLTELGLVGR
ncbi:MAG: DUF4258 domain-containing protein [Coriobacteriales bacterium]|nr:DUF4258 domain-containing protein [Coriobacteriales bacterium]